MCNVFLLIKLLYFLHKFIKAYLENDPNKNPLDGVNHPKKNKILRLDNQTF